MSADPDLDYPGDVEDDAEYEGLTRRLALAFAIRCGKRNLNKARALLAEREAEAQDATDVDTRYRARERERAAYAAWAATPAGQEQAARVRTLGLLDAGPVCPAERTEPADRYEGTNSASQAGSGAHRPGRRR